MTSHPPPDPPRAHPPSGAGALNGLSMMMPARRCAHVSQQRQHYDYDDDEYAPAYH